MEFVEREEVSFSATGCIKAEEEQQEDLVLSDIEDEVKNDVLGLHSEMILYSMTVEDQNPDNWVRPQRKSELRKEYERTIILSNGFEILKNTYVKAAEEARENLRGEFDSSQVYHISVIESGSTKQTVELKEGEVIVIGRHYKCEFKSSNKGVSRVNCVITIFNGRVMVFDFYSLVGTWIEQTATLGEGVRKMFEKIQSVHKFNPGETATLVIGEKYPPSRRHPVTKIYISNRECSICYINPRGVTFERCGHNTMCEECYETYSSNKTSVECIVCKTINPVSSVQHVPCIHTMAPH